MNTLFLNITFLMTDVLYFCRIPTERVERSPLKPLQSLNCNGTAVTIKAAVNQRLTYASSEACISRCGKEQSTGQMSGTVQGKDLTAVNGTGIRDKMEDGKTSRVYGSKSFCQWDKATAEHSRIHKESEGGQNGEERRTEGGGGEPKQEENTEQKLFNIANELLQTERAYVARLHLLDQVSVVICLWLLPRKGIKSLLQNEMVLLLWIQRLI